MISRRIVWAMRDARRRLGQSEELLLTRQAERLVDGRSELEPVGNPVASPDDKCAEELVPQTIIESGV
jgi:hypothetical protein